MSALIAVEGRELVMDDGERIAVPDFCKVWPVADHPGAHGLGFIGADERRRGMPVRPGQTREQIAMALEWLSVHHQKHGVAPVI